MTTITDAMRKQINIIRNVHESLANEEQTIKLALKYVAEMCDEETMKADCMFYVGENDEGNISLIIEVF